MSDTSRERQAAAVLFALNPNYVRPGSCVFCGIGTMNFRMAALNPDGEQKGICSNCYAMRFGTENLARYFDGGPGRLTLAMIRNGDFD